MLWYAYLRAWFEYAVVKLSFGTELQLFHFCLRTSGIKSWGREDLLT